MDKNKINIKTIKSFILNNAIFAALLTLSLTSQKFSHYEKSTTYDCVALGYSRRHAD